jgi:hypothetical protein
MIVGAPFSYHIDSSKLEQGERLLHSLCQLWFLWSKVRLAYRINPRIIGHRSILCPLQKRRERLQLMRVVQHATHEGLPRSSVVEVGCRKVLLFQLLKDSLLGIQESRFLQIKGIRFSSTSSCPSQRIHTI